MSSFKNSVSDYQKVLNHALQLLAQREHGAGELETKLKKRGYKAELIAEALLKCKALKYIDDPSMAGRFITERKRKGYGPRHIKQSLRNKGVLEQDITTALNRYYPYEEEIEIARLAAAKKKHRLYGKPNSKSYKQKLYAHLLYRGFSPEAIRQIITNDNSE